MLGLIHWTSASMSSCNILFVCKACWIHVQVMLYKCIRHAMTSFTGLADERCMSCWGYVRIELDSSTSHLGFVFRTVKISSTDIFDELHVSYWINV